MHRLKNPVDVRRFLQRVINETYEGKLDTKVANSIYNGCNVLLSSFRTDEQEKRLADIEKMLSSDKEAIIDGRTARIEEAERIARQTLPTRELDGFIERSVS